MVLHARAPLMRSTLRTFKCVVTARVLRRRIQVQSAREVAQLQEWFETHWNEAAEVTDAVIETIARHTHRYTPFDVYAKALQEYFRGHELTATEWDETRSKMFPRIDHYQQEAYRALMRTAPMCGNHSRRCGSHAPSFVALGAKSTTRFPSCSTNRSISIRPTKVLPRPTPSHGNAPPCWRAIFMSAR